MWAAPSGGSAGSTARVILRPISAREIVGCPLRSVTRTSARSRGNDWQMMAAKRPRVSRGRRPNAIGWETRTFSRMRGTTAARCLWPVLAFEESVKARILGAIATAAALGAVGLQRRRATEDHYSGHQTRNDAGCSSTSRPRPRTSTASPCSASPCLLAKQPRRRTG
jgi:hypothetical protein